MSTESHGGAGGGAVAAAAVDPRRTLADLAQLREISATAAGAQRVAWTPTWRRAREWLVGRLDELGLAGETDEAGNLWATLEGERPTAVIVGSHLDSVPGGGWLDGCLGVLAGLEVMRGFAAGPRPAVTLRLVDWADEEGARFGWSLFGSSAAAGALELDAVRGLADADGVLLPEALAAYGIQLERAGAAAGRLRDAAAYLELHIEQGPVLEEGGAMLAAVDGAVGIERHRVRFSGRAAHAGATPMRVRRDPVVAASRFIVAVRELAVELGAVATCARVDAQPGIPTAIAESALVVLDERAADASVLSELLLRSREASREIAAAEGGRVEWEEIQRVAPVSFDPRLVELARDCVGELTGTRLALRSGALHDAVMVARAGVPTVMLFVRSIGGISHSRHEDSDPQHIETAVVALDRLTRAVVAEACERG